MAASTCLQCGKEIVQPRGGSRPKKFCAGACRARWNRTHEGAVVPPAAVEPPAAAVERRATLERLYEQLKADVERFGTMIEGPKGVTLNPAVAELRRVVVELERFAPKGEPAPAESEESIDSALRVA